MYAIRSYYVLADRSAREGLWLGLGFGLGMNLPGLEWIHVSMTQFVVAVTHLPADLQIEATIRHLAQAVPQQADGLGQMRSQQGAAQQAGQHHQQRHGQGMVQQE